MGNCGKKNTKIENQSIDSSEIVENQVLKLEYEDNDLIEGKFVIFVIFILYD